jgi:hypothetical protein
MKDKPIILITPPEVIQHELESFNDGIVKNQEFDYTNSHVIYKGCDLGSFKELVELKQKADRTEKAIKFIEDSVLYTYSETYEEYEFDYSLDDEQVFELLGILKGE